MLHVHARIKIKYNISFATFIYNTVQKFSLINYYSTLEVGIHNLYYNYSSTYVYYKDRADCVYKQYVNLAHADWESLINSLQQ